MLQWQNISIPFGQGIDTNINPTQLQIGKLTVLENCVIKQGGSISKRNGFKNLTNNVLNDYNPINFAIASAEYNNEIVLFDTKNLYTYDESINKWINRGTCTSVKANYNPITNNSFQQTNGNITQNNDLALITYDDSAGGSRYSIINIKTNTVLVDNKILSNTAKLTQAVTFNNLLIATTASQSGVITAFILNPNGTKSQIALTADLKTTSLRYFVTVLNNNLYLTYNSTNNTTKTLTFNTSFIQTNEEIILNNNCDNGLHVDVINNDLLYVTVTSDLELKIQSLTYNKTIQLTNTPLHITGIEYDSDYIVYFDTLSAIYQVTNQEIVLIKSLTLNSKPFIYNNVLYLITNFDSTLQKTTFLINNKADIVCKLESGNGNGLRTTISLSNTILNDNKYYSYSSKYTSLISNDGTVYANPSAHVIKFDFDSNYQSALLNNSLYVTGGLLQVYDGATVTENNFNLYPENVSFTVLPTGNIPNGLYSYQITFENTDHNGIVIESAPSQRYNITINNNSGFGSVNIQIPTLFLTKKENVRVVIYRTKEATVGDSLFYKVTDEVNPIINNKSVDTQTFIDNQTDEQIASKLILYCSPDFNGNQIEIENSSAPNCDLVVAYKNRLVIANTLTNRIYFSKTITPNSAPNFSDSVFYIDVDSAGGTITGLEVLDGNLIIFKENRMFALSGQGPTNANQQNDFTDVISIASDVGLINANSTVLVSSTGIFFQSTKGIFLLDRSFTTLPVGAEVNQLVNSQTIISADQVPKTYEIRFTCSDGDCIVYNYFWKQWATFTKHKAVDAGIINNLYYHVTNDGIVHLETPDNYLDDTQPITMRLKTGWISFNQVQGYQRCNYFMLLGDFIGHHTITFNCYYDGSKSYLDSHTKSTTDIINLNIYGQNEIYGNNGVYGGSYENEQYKVFPKNQRHQRLQLEIIVTDTINTASVNLIGLLFRIGGKQSTPINANKHL